MNVAITGFKPNTFLTSCPAPAPRPVVIIQHGLFYSSADFLVNLVNESLAYLLADAGADVWISNSRGTSYSRNHTRLDPRDLDFWKFS